MNRMIEWKENKIHIYYPKGKIETKKEKEKRNEMILNGVVTNLPSLLQCASAHRHPCSVSSLSHTIIFPVRYPSTNTKATLGKRNRFVRVEGTDRFESPSVPASAAT